MKYFVLKVEGDSWHAIASRSAMMKYADEVEAYDGKLAEDIREWVRDEHDKALRGVRG